MDISDNDDSKKLTCRLTLIESIDAPEGMPEGNWHRYIVEYGNSQLTCIRSGTLQEVTDHAKQYVDDLNYRTSNVKSIYSHRRQTK